MFGRKNARIAELENENDRLSAENVKWDRQRRQALADLGDTAVELGQARSSRDIALRLNAHLTAERDKLAADLQPFLDRRAAATRNLKQFQPKAGDGGSNGITAKANGAAVQAVVS